MDMHSTLPLNNGTRIPRLGFGVFRLESGRETEQAVIDALEVGYRHLDTASIYGNEEDVARAIAKSGISRDDLFITGKLWTQDMTDHKQAEAIKRSLEKLQMDYFDLYLIHWPVAGHNLETWDQLINFAANGWCKAIGVSNFHISHLQEITVGGRPQPAVNQVELHPLGRRPALVEYCQGHNIVLEAYSPLGGQDAGVLQNETICQIAQKHKKSPAQVVIRWDLQNDTVVFPKSSNKQRMIENADVFDFSLDAEDMASLNDLNQNHNFGGDEYVD